MRSAFFSMGQKTVFGFIIALVAILSLYIVKDLYLIEIPRAGGTYSETLVGAPRYINPVLAVSQTDKDISRLVYAPLLRNTVEGNDLVLASSVEASQDSTEYILTLKDNIFFHDGEKITTSDIAYTIGQIQDPVIASPLRPLWLGVETQIVDEQTIIFELERSFPEFTKLLELGVLPEHIWQEISAEDFPFTTNNIQPVGSGPYVPDTIMRGDSEAIVEYRLRASRNSIFNPNIDEIHLLIAQDTQSLIDSLNNSDVDGVSGIRFESINKDRLDELTIRTYTLPRVFTLFYNREQNTALSDNALRSAINVLVDKEMLVQEVLGGYGQALDGPLPSTSPFATLHDPESDPEDRVSEAREFLEDGGWSFQEE